MLNHLFDHGWATPTTSFLKALAVVLSGSDAESILEEYPQWRNAVSA